MILRTINFNFAGKTHVYMLEAPRGPGVGEIEFIRIATDDACNLHGIEPPSEFSRGGFARMLWLYNSSIHDFRLKVESLSCPDPTARFKGNNDYVMQPWTVKAVFYDEELGNWVSA